MMHWRRFIVTATAITLISLTQTAGLGAAEPSPEYGTQVVTPPIDQGSPLEPPGEPSRAFIASDTVKAKANIDGEAVGSPPDAVSLAAGVDPNSTQTINIFPGKVATLAGTSGLSDMQGLVIIGASAYILDTGGISPNVGRIQKVNLSTGQTSVLAQGGSCTTGVNSKAAAIATDGADLYVVNNCGNGSSASASIVKVTLSGTISAVATHPVLGTQWDSLTVASDGYIYASACCNRGLDRVDPTNGSVIPGYIQSLQVSGQARSISGIQGMTADGGSVWVSCVVASLSNTLGLLKVDLSNPGAGVFYWSNDGSLVGGGQLASAGKYLYAPSSSRGGVVRVTKRTGGVGLIAGSNGGSVTQGDADGEWTYARFDDVQALAPDGADGIWVADQDNGKLKEVRFAALRAQEFGTGGSADLSSPTVTNGDPVTVASGNFSENFTDVSLPGIGLPFVFGRTYNSMDVVPDASAGRFGAVGWSDSLDASVESGTDDGGPVYLVRLPSGQVARFDRVSLSPRPGTFSALAVGTDSYTLTQPDGTRWLFDQLGLLSAIKDRNDHTITVTREAPLTAWSRVDSVTDTAGRVIDFRYGSCGYVDRISLADSRFVEYAYDSACRLQEVFELDADGVGRKSTVYTWSGSQLASISRGLGAIVQNSYDSFGRVLTQQVAISASSYATTTYAYTAAGGSTTATATRNGHTWTYVSTADGIVQDVTDPSGNLTRYLTYNGDHLPTSIQRPGPQVWQYSYNTAGAVLSITPPPPLAGGVITYTYNSTFKRSRSR